MEKATTIFLNEYLNLSSEQEQALKTYVDEVMSMQDQQEQITATPPVFQKVKDVNYE